MMRAAVSEIYKLIINLLDTDEFYDLEKDPHEKNNREYTKFGILPIPN